MDDLNLIKYKNLIYKIYSTMKINQNKLYTEDDYINRGYGAVDKALKSFDSSKGVKFTTYAYSAIKYAFLRMITEENKNKYTSLDIEVGEDAKIYDMIPDNTLMCSYRDIEMHNVFKEIYNNITEDQKEYMKILMGFKTQRALAKEMNISNERVRQKIENFKRKIRFKFKHLNRFYGGK